MCLVVCDILFGGALQRCYLKTLTRYFCVFSGSDCAAEIIHDFVSTYASGLIELQQNISRYFDAISVNVITTTSSSSVGSVGGNELTSRILKQALTQLLLYYQRFHDFVKRQNFVLRELMPVHTLMFDIKKVVSRT